MSEKIIKRAGEVIAEKINNSAQNFCTLALINTDGYPYTTTISIKKADGIRWLILTTGKSAKTDMIERCNKASICVNAAEYHIALTGTIELLTDPDVKKELWNDNMKEYYSGWDDPNYCVLKFTTERYSLLVDWQEARGSLT
ncbi:MAG: pyridoxamine 5'-phosphate oxidase family protein [Ruminococcus sp.]|nr:pyridoxamine 5'-phosphate oxidase family protein [Ruminococcus sp.]